MNQLFTKLRSFLLITFLLASYGVCFGFIVESTNEGVIQYILQIASIGFHFLLYFTAKRWGTNRTPLKLMNESLFREKVDKLLLQAGFNSVTVSDILIADVMAFRKADNLSPWDVSAICISKTLKELTLEDREDDNWRFAMVARDEYASIHKFHKSLIEYKEQGLIKRDVFHEGVNSVASFKALFEIEGFDDV